jgi:DNA polymerase
MDDSALQRMFDAFREHDARADTRLHLDWEWKSRLDVTRCGISRTTRDPSTVPLMLAFAFDDEAVEQWVPVEGERMPARLRDALRDPRVTKFSWNKPAEYCTFKNCLGIEIPHDQWRDPMVLALSLSLPGKLSKAGKALGMPEDKQKDSRGLQLIRMFSRPNRKTKARPQEWRDWTTDPVEWEEFKDYNRQDVVAERAIYKRCRKWDLPAHEWALWALDQEINEAGVPINMNVVRNALVVAADVTRDRFAQMRELTGLANPNSGKQLLPWLRDRGYPYEDLKKGHVEKALKALEADVDSIQDLGLDPDEDLTRLHRVLALRTEVAKASVKKYQALERAVDHDGLLRYMLQFAGAGRTWRWAGRLFQVQNLARPAPWLEKCQEMAVQHLEQLDTGSIELLYASSPTARIRRSPMELLSTCVRPVIQAPKGFVFLDVDLNAIENRVLGWLAQDQKILDVFKYGRDPYVDFATYMFGQPYDVLYAEYKAGDKTKRTTAKPGVLGCGYMLGPGEERENEQTGEIEATGLLGYAWNMGVALTAEQSKLSVKVWRDTFEDAVTFWGNILKAAKRCIRTGRESECGFVRFKRSGPWLEMWLPSGRALRYLRPKLRQRMAPWGELRETIVYEGLNDKKHWGEIKTHPGKLTENADQAIARDILAHGIVLARKECGLDLRLHVHDQNLVLIREDDADEGLKILKECMAVQPRWAPGLPLDSAGGISHYFLKD